MRHALFGLAACVAASSAFAADVQPTDVVFVDGAIEASLSGAAGDPASGAEIMNKGAGNCIACHQVSALSHLSFHGEIGPPLDGVADRWSEAEIRGIVANAKVMFEGSMMPSFYKTQGFVRLGDAYTGEAHADGEVHPLLTAQQVEDVVAFLMTLNEQ
ncbi:monoheme cytochrome SoxX (sulfur oxidation) [Roseibium hamelinense]|uniref:Monoheme cytochrome SoxX (Sulfur oxidation) n=1 Tax=Roseibium hamelinense TaxID=150831 RepID=A0A562SUQ3_9HYPH|nr:sulfur oxidation c-type cytochrome SoxX [Roseibium hamelinense]MTI43197.1 sulfur oxidation c-type cytochrome SoxX [Roseibium hamelinense]TWI84754.1 monoheme cytochrome SoxX (sulfur oxidation) [Roseibium hamelinense]